ncbi:MAG: hypothetical protein AB7S26_21810 [Sandaracinaceae bacterium]
MIANHANRSTSVAARAFGIALGAASLVACGGGTTSATELAPRVTTTCELGPPLAAATTREVAGYPSAHPTLSPAELEARATAIAARVSGWSVDLTPHGAPRVLWRDGLGTPTDPPSATYLDALTELFTVLADELRTGVPVEVGWEHSRERRVRFYVTSPPSGERLPYQIDPQDVAGGRLMVTSQSLDVPVPLGVVAMSPEEARVAWGDDGESRNVIVHLHAAAHACDPVSAAGDCVQDDERPSERCVPVSEIPLRLDIAHHGDVTRIVYRAECPDGTSCELEMVLPPCVDAIDGERLTDC